MSASSEIAKKLKEVLDMSEWTRVSSEKRFQFFKLYHLYKEMEESQGGECPRCGGSLITRTAMIECEEQECDYWVSTT